MDNKSVGTISLLLAESYKASPMNIAAILECNNNVSFFTLGLNIFLGNR